MQVYVGYGFDTNQIDDKTWVKLAKKYNKETYKEIQKEISVKTNNSNEAEEMLTDRILQMIEEENYSQADYLKNIINGTEFQKADDYIVSTYDNYLVFDSIRFTDDSKRTSYIRNQEDFVSMIARYIPTDNITFGNLYEGNDWIDPCYFLD